ncbi:MAG TPA: LEA type 2 family protein [Thermoanaerobaculia bacterium]|jgi:LEA14-like dessication related protein|nr:LEA type 2 family protein [Thermoanaerobaculia bacterium]
MTAFAVALFALRLAGPSPAPPLGFALGVEGQTTLRVTLSGPAADLAAGPFQGAIALNGSTSEMSVSGTVAHAGGRWVLPVSVRYADVPQDWADRFRADGFTYRLRSAGAAPREWTGSRSWKDVELEGSREALADFLVLDDVSLTDVSLLSSEARATLTVRNPFAFPLKIASSQYVLFADGREVGSGQTQGLVLHPGQKNVLALPIDVDHAALLGAAGGAVLTGGDVAVQIKGKLVVRLKGGDVVLPLALSGNLSDRS